ASSVREPAPCAPSSLSLHDALPICTASFQPLTQVILPRGSHQLSMALFDPAGRELERISFGTVRADADNDTLSLEGTWRNIRFEQAGVLELELYWQRRAAARFHLVVR